MPLADTPASTEGQAGDDEVCTRTVAKPLRVMKVDGLSGSLESQVPPPGLPAYMPAHKPRSLPRSLAYLLLPIHSHMRQTHC